MGGSPLQVGLERGLNQIEGIRAEYFIPHRPYDYDLLFNQCSHTTNYNYGNLSNLDNYKLAFIDTAEYGWTKRLPGVLDLYYSTFAAGAMQHDTKNPAQQQYLFNYLNGKSFPYLIREYLKKISYPSMYHPIDYPLYHLSEYRADPVREQYLERPLDLFISWGGSHPFRMNITQKLRNCPVKSEIYVIEEITPNGKTPRMLQDQYFNKMLAAKASVSYDGYGSGSFRETEALCRTLLLKGETSIIQRDPLQSGVNCVEFKVTTNEDGTEFLDSDVDSLLLYYLKDPEKCFEIYRKGFEHCMKYFTEKATAEYVLRIIKNHDWSKPTPLLLS